MNTIRRLIYATIASCIVPIVLVAVVCCLLLLFNVENDIASAALLGAFFFAAPIAAIVGFVFAWIESGHR